MAYQSIVNAPLSVTKRATHIVAPAVGTPSGPIMESAVKGAVFIAYITHPLLTLLKPVLMPRVEPCSFAAALYFLPCFRIVSCVARICFSAIFPSNLTIWISLPNVIKDKLYIELRGE